jgi:hypothetical protein
MTLGNRTTPDVWVIDEIPSRIVARVRMVGATRFRCGVAVCAFVCALFTCLSRAEPQDATKASRPEMHRLRFQVVDSTSSRGVVQATVILVLWQKRDSGEEKKELEGKTGENGFVEFADVNPQKFAITVTMKGYRSYWRWIRGPDWLKQLSLIKL